MRPSSSPPLDDRCTQHQVGGHRNIGARRCVRVRHSRFTGTMLPADGAGEIKGAARGGNRPKAVSAYARAMSY